MKEGSLHYAYNIIFYRKGFAVSLPEGNHSFDFVAFKLSAERRQTGPSWVVPVEHFNFNYNMWIVLNRAFDVLSAVFLL